MKVAICYSEKSFRNHSQQQLASSTYQHAQQLKKFLTNTCLGSEFSADFVEIE